MPLLVHYEAGGGRATITLDSPHNRNALSPALIAELSAALETAIADDTVRVIVLTSAGAVFCSGLDLKSAGGPAAASAVAGSAAAGSGPVGAFPEILGRIWESPTPVIAAVRGPARAGGIGLVAACDLAVATESATFAFTEVRLGLVPAVISVTVLPRLLPQAAHELFLTGAVFDGARAAAAGLVTAVVPDDELDAAVDRYVDLLAQGAPGALAATKALLRSRSTGAGTGPLPAEFAAMAALSASHVGSAEGREGIRAFIEKRPPRWVPSPTSSTSSTSSTNATSATSATPAAGDTGSAGYRGGVVSGWLDPDGTDGRGADG